MNADLLYKARLRKGSYLVAVLLLFSFSLLWRGVIPLPFANAAAASERERKGEPQPFADRMAASTLLSQADRLELRELDQGDPDVATSAAQYALVGIRGPIVTGLWWAAIEKQKRNEWQEFQQLIELVTHLQPNFITPWIFQSWNIAYNVSVENEKLSDMYYYISQGINLLAKGDRVNTKTYRARGQEPIEVGSPDIRFQIAFYYQNKFGVSDKVATLRSLMQLSCIKPADRNPDSFLNANGVDLPRFLEFCKRNPQLVRRLKAKLNCTTPKDVIDFLRMNQSVPTRYEDSGELKADHQQFPILPPQFGDAKEYHPKSVTTDTFDAFLAARGWFGYASSVVPPSPPGEPSAAPKRGDYDEFRYRMPQRPALVIFRTQPARAQHYLADRLTDEGWFTADTEWEPDAVTDSPWFPKPEDPALAKNFQPVKLKAGDSAQAEWAVAHQMWRDFGNINGMTEATLTRYLSDDALANAFLRPNELPPPAKDFPDEEIDRLYPPTDVKQSNEARRNRAREIITARRAVILYRQNLSMTNFRFFLDKSEAMATLRLMEASRLQWDANLALRGGEANRPKALRLYAEALVKYREACKESPAFHAHDESQEKMFDIENAIATELKREISQPALGALVPQLLDTAGPELIQLWAEDVTMRRVAAVTPENDLDARSNDATIAVVGAAVGGWTVADSAKTDPIRNAIRLNLIDGDFAWLKRYTSPDMTLPWIKPSVREASKIRVGMAKPPPAPTVPTAAPVRPN